MSDASVATAVAAIVSFARNSDGAQLPPFPSALSGACHFVYGPHLPPSVLKPFVTDRIPGEVLPRGSDAWLALLPFNDLNKHVPAALRRQLVQRRRAFVEMLARVARVAPSSPFRWDAMTDINGSGGTSANGKTSFWIDLTRTLDPEAVFHDKTHEMARCLIAMSHTKTLRFMVCVTQEVMPAEIPDWLERMLGPVEDAASIKSVNDVLEACGAVPSESAGRPAMVVEIGLSFSKTEITAAFMKKVMSVIERCSHRRAVQGGAELRVTSLRFGRDCVIQPKAIEVLGEPDTLSSIEVLDLGDLQGVKPASLRLGINGVLKRTRRLRRLVVSSPDAFKAVASALRNGDSFVEELDLLIEPSVECAAWLAFAFFHVDSKSRTSSLRLRLPTIKGFGETEPSGLLTDAWMAVFKLTLRSITRVRELVSLECQEEELESSTRRFVSIKICTSVKATPTAGATILYKIGSVAEKFEVIATHDKWLAVIVPGLGIGWVRATSVISETLVASELPTDAKGFATNRVISSLVWHGANSFGYPQLFDDHVKATLEMVQIVGKPLQSLHLPGLSLTTERIAQVLTWCPDLTDLNVSGHAMTLLAPIVHAYTSGSCKIETLSIVRTERSISFSSITHELSTALRDARCYGLRRLAVSIRPERIGDARATAKDKEGALELTRLLASSPLEFVQLPGSGLWRYGHVGPVPPIQSAVDVSANPFYYSPMATRMKLAFLSCLQSRGERSTLRRLDTCMLALIFHFSGNKVARQVIMDAPLAVDRGRSLSDIAGRFPYVSNVSLPFSGAL